VYYIGLKDSISQDLAGLEIQDCQNGGYHRASSCLVRAKRLVTKVKNHKKREALVNKCVIRDEALHLSQDNLIQNLRYKARIKAGFIAY